MWILRVLGRGFFVRETLIFTDFMPVAINYNSYYFHHHALFSPSAIVFCYEFYITFSGDDSKTKKFTRVVVHISLTSAFALSVCYRKFVLVGVVNVFLNVVKILKILFQFINFAEVKYIFIFSLQFLPINLPR